jgi:dipeptidyl aminopeptidase/acylaminoacyl peptidase
MRTQALLAVVFVIAAHAAPRRPLRLEDVDRLLDVDEPRVSPDGKWIAYTVGRVDASADKQITDLWMVSWDGTQDVRLTYASGEGSASAPRWSPDGRYLTFLSSRPGKSKGKQVWALDRRGGEAFQLTNVKGQISSYEWSPDSTRLAMVMTDRDASEAEDKKDKDKDEETPPKPLEISRYHFKEDTEGYLSGALHRIQIFDIALQALNPLTKETKFEEDDPEWSPDGRQIAFVSNRDQDWERTLNTDVFIADARPGAVPRRLTTWTGPDAGKLSWSPDGASIAYLQGSDPRYNAYNLDHLAIVPVQGGPGRVLTGDFDRSVSSAAFTTDGRAVTVLVSDDRSAYPARVSLSGSGVERLLGGHIVVIAQSTAAGHLALALTRDSAPAEIFALDGGSLRQLTHHNDALVAELQLGAVEEISFLSKDGSEVHGMITKPPSFDPSQKYPALLRIHGGPNLQDEHEFRFDRQFLAANGYVVISVNYRGSAGRGRKFSEAIFADWGNKEVDDLLAGVDYAVSLGYIDPRRLGIGGWSYGGILTDYTIARDQRFKAAIAGAGSANQLSMYGSDEYVFQYDIEIGPPWKNPEGWMKVSYPFFHADRIHTPTLFMGGDKDFNVPIAGSEQMYQALRTTGVPTAFVVYPGEYHDFTRPSFIRDRLRRYVAWYDKYLKDGAAAGSAE